MRRNEIQVLDFFIISQKDRMSSYKTEQKAQGDRESENSI